MENTICRKIQYLKGDKGGGRNSFHNKLAHKPLLIKVNQGTTLDERFFGQKPNLNKLRYFGNIIHVHMTNEKCKKLNPKFLYCVIVSKPRLSNVIIHLPMK